MNARSTAVGEEWLVLPSEVKDRALVERRRAQLVKASLQLFAQRGYHPTSVRDIARSVGVSVGSVYTYFSSKEDILEFACGQMAAQFTSRFEELRASSLEGSTLECLRRAFSLLIELVDAESDLHLVVYRESSALAAGARRRMTAVERMLSEVFGALLREGMASGQVRSHDVALRAQTAVFLAQMWALKRCWLASHLDRERFITEQFQLLVGDIALQAPSRPGPADSDPSVDR
jgi:AcrR family transcriptional regulator